MKVLSYLEVSIKSMTDYYGYSSNMNHLIGNKRLEQFYSQPFKPELIIELFEGWIRQDIEFVNKSGITILITDTIIDYFAGNENKGNVLTPPRTLDDFINDCQRAGIELEWRKI